MCVGKGGEAFWKQAPPLLTTTTSYCLLVTFWKHEPPKPTLALRNFEPMRVSTPMACATSLTLAPVTW